VNVGGYRWARTRPRLRAAVNARLEEISFRTGLITASMVLVALAAIAAAGVFAATLGLGSPAVAAAGALSAASAPAVIPATTASAPPAMPRPPQASSTPKATQPVTAATTSPQPAAGSRPWPRAYSSQARTRYYGRPGFGYGSWHGGPGLPGHGYGFPGPRGFGRP
jgi:hypothetical protein